LLIKKHTLYETMNNLSSDQLEQIHREGVTDVIFKPKNGVLLPSANNSNYGG